MVLLWGLGASAAVAAAAAAAAPPVAPPTAFDIYWNGPSGGCHPALPLENYSGIRVNANQAFVGEEIACMYSIGVFPRITATQNATPCWSSHVAGCSWNPWDQLTPVANGGVPQAANLTLHLEKLTADVEAAIPDPAFAGLLVIDWEAWRPLQAENDDGLSCYTEYSRRLVAADPAWSGKTPSAIQAEANRRFNVGAQDFFTATVAGVKKLRPHARVGYYSQGINHGAASGGVPDLLWLWSAVDAVFPSVYPRGTNGTADALSVADAVRGAVLSADLAENASKAAGDKPPHRPAVFPYARALVAGGMKPFTPDMLAAQVQVPAGLGADGVVLWGSSGDYHGTGCEMIAQEISGFAGDTMSACVRNRVACAAAACSGHGRCVDYDPATLDRTCLDSAAMATAACRCDPGYAGPACATSVG